ncbi:MAG: YggN family protein [Lysobacter sp.]|nr:YggN family protein [Lysobacter sp.]
MRGMVLASVLFTTVLLLASTGANAREISCDVESDYDFALTDKSVVFTRESGAPQAILMRQGRLFVDGRWVALSPTDRDRVIAYERDARGVMPLAQQIGRDAADIAFTTLGEVAAGFSNNPAQTRAKLAKARVQLDARLARSVTANHFNGDDLGEGIGAAVKDALPSLMGDIVGGAIRAAFSGDTAQLKRMENMDKLIEARVAPRAKALERNAELLCNKMEALDRIDNALEYRLNGKPLDLLEIRLDAKHRNND